MVLNRMNEIIESPSPSGMRSTSSNFLPTTPHALDNSKEFEPDEENNMQVILSTFSTTFLITCMILFIYLFDVCNLLSFICLVLLIIPFIALLGSYLV